ncbi:heat shock factor protein-like isoform X2 [Euwallacea fornicatus]|uniref:heat shock factor protein-like isoform X2 n=1 Tax=Euwallacea fornicatus TaxID=995702 RepID=UPI00338EB7E6
MHPYQEVANIPGFLGKLWKMVNDPNTDHLICWNEAGNTFSIQNQTQFWYELLPLYYKHNNMSSFVRQLNLYGFHKITNNILGNPSVVCTRPDKDDQTYQFYHPCFQKGKPEKLCEIKRKAKISKPHEEPGVVSTDDLTKVLTDVKQLRGRQTSVDSQLSAMRQENAVLWRELAILRQKHVKQQQIVNKLIQFLATLVTPATTPRVGVGVKRCMPLMLPETPVKKNKSKKNNRQHSESGPTIHELDTEYELSPEQLLEEASVIEGEEDIPLDADASDLGMKNKIDSPVTPRCQISQDTACQTAPSPIPAAIQNDLITAKQQPLLTNNSDFWDKPEFVNIEDAMDEMSGNEEELMNTLERNVNPTEKVFLNPYTRDTLIGSHMSPLPSNVATNVSGGRSHGNGSNIKTGKSTTSVSTPAAMQVARKQPSIKISTGNDLDLHVDSTKNELEQLKDILNGCNNFDANTLLGLFSENDTFNDAAFPSKSHTAIEGAAENQDDPPVIDFTELLDDDLCIDGTNLTTDPAPPPDQASSSLNTPVKVLKNEPLFPRKS